MHHAFEIEPDDNGAFLVTVPAFPEVATFCETPEQAAHFAALAISEAFAARIAFGLAVPVAEGPCSISE